MDTEKFYKKNSGKTKEQYRGAGYKGYYSHHRNDSVRNNGAECGNYKSNGSRGEGKILPDNRMQALAELHINPTDKLRRDETVFFQLYLNYAVYNICKTAAIPEDVTSDGVVNAIKKAGKIYKLANFFWLFQADEPEKNYPDYEKFTLAIAHKIFELREYFTHLNENGVSPLVVDEEFYHFVGGVLAAQALEASVKPGMRSAKLFKMKLFARRDKEKKLYEFTRRGIIFLTSLALYKDDAYEFTQSLQDMKLPTCVKGTELSEEECCCECEDFSTCSTAVAKAFVSMFTYFSNRRGRSVNLLEDDMNYLAFADITGYLNKVPPDAANYLTLDAETQMLRERADGSTESEENKRFKYSLHKRAKARFISLAAAYCEDFKLFPSIKFKRLDTSENMGRKRYTFGASAEYSRYSVPLYHIENKAIRFSWAPKAKQHYGPIHITSLRSAVSAGTLKEMLFAAFAKEPVNRYLDEYFTAYHKILETMLNTRDTGDLVLVFEKLLPEFEVISNQPREKIKNDISLLNGFFSENLLRFFRGENFHIDDETLRCELVKKIELQICHADDFLVRISKLNEWKEELKKRREKDPEARLPQPVCDSSDVKFPPRSCDISECSLIARVFDYFNLYLENDQKFRQLPPGEQHRGEIDHEYQFVHSLIGKYALDPKALKYFIENKKQVLLPAWDALQQEILKMRQQLQKKLPPKYNKFGRPVMPPATLAMLGEGAVRCSRAYLQEKLAHWKKPCSGNRELLYKVCRKFGIRPGMPMDWNSLIKTILHIDLGAWMHAFDYTAGANSENRSLEQEGHIVPQIPLPGDIARRLLAVSKKHEMEPYKKEGSFDSGAAIRAMDLPVSLRDFYDVSPLVAANICLKQGKLVTAIPGLKTTVEEGAPPLDLSRSAIKKAIVNIKEAWHQDLLLAKMALDYWERFQERGAFISCTKKNKTKLALTGKPSLYEYFDAAVQLKFDDAQDDRLIIIMPNDVNKPILAQIREEAAIIAASMDETGTQREFEFYEMLKEYRRIQTRDRQKRLACIPLLNQFDNAVRIPQSEYIKGNKAHNREMEFRYYHKVFPKLSFEEYNFLADGRNPVFHNKLAIEVRELIELLKKYVSLPEVPRAVHQKGTWIKK